MKISFIFIGTFVLINVLKYKSAKYLLIDVRGNDVGFPAGSPPINCEDTLCEALKFEPVCATNGKTYTNECAFEYAKLCEDRPFLRIDYEGACKDPPAECVDAWQEEACLKTRDYGKCGIEKVAANCKMTCGLCKSWELNESKIIKMERFSALEGHQQLLNIEHRKRKYNSQNFY